MSLIHVATYFLDPVAGPYGFAFRRGNFVCLLDGRRIIVLVVIIIIAAVHNTVVVSRRGVRTEDVRGIHPRVLRIGFQVELDRVNGTNGHEGRLITPVNDRTGVCNYFDYHVPDSQARASRFRRKGRRYIRTVGRWNSRVRARSKNDYGFAPCNGRADKKLPSSNRRNYSGIGVCSARSGETGRTKATRFEKPAAYAFPRAYQRRK